MASEFQIDDSGNDIRTILDICNRGPDRLFRLGGFDINQNFHDFLFNSLGKLAQNSPADSRTKAFAPPRKLQMLYPLARCCFTAVRVKWLAGWDFAAHSAKYSLMPANTLSAAKNETATDQPLLTPARNRLGRNIEHLAQFVHRADRFGYVLHANVGGI